MLEWKKERFNIDKDGQERLCRMKLFKRSKMTKPLEESVGGVQGKHNLKISPHSLLINYQGRKVLFNVVFLPEKKKNF